MDRLMQFQDEIGSSMEMFWSAAVKECLNLDKIFLWQLNPLVKARIMLYFKTVPSDLYFGYKNASWSSLKVFIDNVLAKKIYEIS